MFSLKIESCFACAYVIAKTAFGGLQRIRELIAHGLYLSLGHLLGHFVCFGFSRIPLY